MTKSFSFIPIIDQLKGYSKVKFRGDLLAGFAVGTVLVPQAMAYALLAGVDPVYGLYTGLVPLLFYAIFGSSTKLSIGPVAISSILVLDGVSKLATPFSSDFLMLVLALGFFVGVVQFLMSLLKLGWITNFLSRPVIAGFTSAAAIIIIVSQLKDALGLSNSQGTGMSEKLEYLVHNLTEVHGLTLFISLFTVGILLLNSRYFSRLPVAFFLVALGILVSYLFYLSDLGVAVVGDVPSGLPPFSPPGINFENLNLLMPTIFAVSIIGMVECMSMAKTMENKYKDHKVRPNQELFALGISKMVGSFFSAIPSSSSFSRTAINAKNGASTNLASIFALLLVVLTLLFLTPLFEFLPKAILSSIIIVAVAGLLDYKEAIHLWHTHRQDLAMMATTFFVTLIFGIETGVFSGVILSIVMVLYRSTRPNIAVLGNIPGTAHYRNMERFEQAEGHEEMLIIRFDDQLYFGNADFFVDQIMATIDSKKNKEVKYVILAAQNIHHIDSTGIHKLRDMDLDLKRKGIELHLCSTIGPVRDMLHRSNLLKEKDKHHASVDEAVKFIESRNQGELGQRSVDPFQHNVK